MRGIKISLVSYFLLSLVFFLLASCSNNKAFVEDDNLDTQEGKKELFIKDNLTYNKVTGTPYSGVETSFYANGKIKETTKYKLGDIYKVISFYENGNKKSDINYKNGKKDGLAIFFDENGQKTTEEISVKGELSEKIIFKDMKKIQEDIYKKDETISWYFYDKNISKSIVWSKDKKKKSEKNFKSSIKNGKFTFYYDNEKLKSESFYKNGKQEGKEIFYYENGNKKSEVEYIDGKKEGKFVSWNEDGSKDSEVEYKNDNIKDDTENKTEENTEDNQENNMDDES
jgi:antitoxin component YwqK of YwqJK toxin-antitoxin module